MAINNDRNLLEQQILSNSGLKGKELENLKARLATLSEQQLQAELSKSLSGNNKGEWYTGVMLEHNESVVMRNNHDQTTYTDDNGNEISELKDGDEVLERTIKSTDDKGNTFEITVTFSGGRPLTQIKSKNGNTTETTTYKYNDDADVPFVTVETKKADQSKVTTNVLEVDNNGNFDNEDFIDRKTTLLDGTEIFVTKENGRLTENVKKVGKPEVTTVYNGDNIQDLDSKKLNRLKQNDVYYDGKGNTYVQVNAGETAQIMADRINKKRTAGQPQVTAQQIIELNPNLVKKNGEFVLQKFENGVKGLGEVKVPGEFDANSPFIRTRQSIQKANNLANQAEIDKQIATKVTETTDKKFAAELANNGFKPTRENAIFYNRFNALNPTQQQNVLSIIKYCRSQKITDPNQIKARILETFPEINLFDSGKLIPMNSSFNTPAFQRKNPVALETFLTDTLKLDLKSETGKMVYERLSSLPQEALNKINAQNFGDLSKANFVEVAKRFEANGVDIRTRQEHQIENNSPRMKAEQEKRELRESASQNIALAYDNAINIIKQYQGNQGWINVGFYREKLGKLLSNINPTKINTCFEDVIKELEKEKKFAVGYLKSKSTNDKEFKEAFKKVSGGVEYNEANMKAFLDVAQDQSANFEDEKYNKKFWNAYNKAFGIAKTDKNGKVYYEPQVVKQATSRTNFQQYVDGAGDIVLMLLGTEAIGKGVAWAGGKLVSKVSPYVPKFLANAGSKTVMTIGSNNITVGRVAANMASQSASFTLWDASKNYINLKTKDIQYSGEAAEKEWEAYKEGNVESAKFGAFAGLVNTTVVGKVINGTMKMFEKPIAKAVSKVGKSFETTSTMTGADVLKTFMLNQTPGMLAKTAGTIAEIGGFTLYETANEVVEELIKKDGNGEHHLPTEWTEDGLTSYLWNKLKGQTANLGEIKAISRLIFMHKGAIQEQARLMDENLAKCETLKNVKIKKTEVNGREIFEVTMPDGNRKVANSVEEVIANCNVLMQLDMISNAAKENETVDKKTTLQGMNVEEDALIQKARKENPATVVEEKVRRQWQQSDLETPVPEIKVDLFNLDPNAGLKESAQNVENEVTSLIFKGKLNETLTQRYNEMGKVFTEIAQKRSADIKALAKANPKNKQAVADGIVKILAQELGMEGFEPPIVFENTNGADGYADWPNGRIVINKDITNVKKLTSMISHEFVHMLQYRDVLAQYGEQGLRDLIANDKSIPENEKEQHIKKALNNPYNQHLLQSYDFQKAQTGTVNDYLRRIYKDEFTNTVGTDNMPEYINQAAERGAYSSQEKVDRGLDESNLGELSVGEYVPNDASLAASITKMKAQLKSGQDVSSNNPLNATPKSTETIEIDNEGNITIKTVPAGYTAMSDAEFAAKGKDILKLETSRITEKTISEIFNNSNLTDEQTDAILKDLGMTDKDVHMLHWNKTPNLNQIAAVLKHLSDNSNMVSLSSSDLRFIIDKGVERTDINFIAQLLINNKDLDIKNILGNILFRNYNKNGQDSYLSSEERKTRLDVTKQLLNTDKANLLTEILPRIFSDNKDTILDYYLNGDNVESSTQDIIAQLKSLYPSNVHIESFVLEYAKTNEQKNVLSKLVNPQNIYEVRTILEYMTTSEEVSKQISDFVTKETDLSAQDKMDIIKQAIDGTPLETAESEFIRIRDLRNSTDFKTVQNKLCNMFKRYDELKVEKFIEQNSNSLPKISKYLDLIAKNYTEYDHVYFSDFMEIIKEHPELENMFENMIQMKDYDQTPRFDVFFLMKNILESASKSDEHRKLMEDVLYAKEKNSENYKHEYYSVCTLATLIKDYDIDRVNTVSELMKKGHTSSLTGEKEPFNIGNIEDMMKYTNTDEAKKALFKYIDLNYSEQEIINLMKIHDKHPNQNKLIETLLSMEFEQLPAEFEERKRFGINSVDELVNVYEQYPHEKEFIDDLLKRYDTFENGKLRGPRFESNQIATIVKLSNESKEAREIVKEYIEKSYTYDNGISRSFTGRELNAFVKYSLKSPSHKNIVDKLIERSDNEDCFESVMDAYDENPEYIESIIDMKKTDENGNRVPRFDIQALDYLKDLKYKELLQFEELDVNDIGHYVKYDEAREKLLNDEKYRTVVFTVGPKRWYDELNGDDNCIYSAQLNNVGPYVDFLYKLCIDKNLGYTKDEVSQLAGCMNGAYEEFIQRLCSDTSLGLSHKTIIDTLTALNLNSGMQASFKDKYFDLVYKICTEKKLESAKDALPQITSMIEYDNFDKLENLISNYKSLEITPNQITTLLSEDSGITLKQLQRLNRIMGRDKASKLNETDLKIACTFANLYGKQNINEIPNEGKKDLLHSMVASNIGLFEISDDLSREFPLIPKNQEEYCSLLPSIVRSLGIETNELTPEQRITMFNSSMGELSKSLAEISDTDFAKMTVTQEYPKDKFILDVLDKVKSLPRTERQKVYDYFGFELHHNKENSTGFSITGYPVNLNNGKKLAQIEDPRTKAVVEDLRPNVVRFSENNKIKCNNPQVERFLNEVIDALPELRTAIGRKQHGSQAFDVMQHSLKVMQKITQDPKFTTLNESDQKIMLLASLMHDITKSEGRVDKTHANEGSFDTYFIAQKFNLTKEEEVKLHTLIKNHEWLEYVNTAKSEDQLTKRLQSVAYDLHQGNLFDMAEIFTHADLKAVKIDDSFHDTTEGQSRIGFDGTVRSFGESANIYAERIRGYINELQKSQPLLPQTKVPRASRINEAITQVNPDGSTNIKGVYKDKDGLVVIKFNEVEDWEAIGFPKGSISHGIEIKKGEKGDAELSEDVNTGNIKFFVHALEYSNQLAKFDAFSLVDSDALLSVSYAERPESKFRFFRTQGVILDVNSKYIHGGGDSDSGSGYGKNINEFKRNYIFGGYRQSDRVYVSKLIKKVTGMTDEQYVDFVEKNKDKSLSEIEPVEMREKLIKAFATINSNTRKGKRSYNEMYISNPNEVMGVFAYSSDYEHSLGNPIEFLNKTTLDHEYRLWSDDNVKSVKDRTAFLRQYALERNLPFIIFGD